MEKMSHFFATLGPKQCECCGQPITEQAESYMSECLDCSEKKYMIVKA
ncbi:YhfH family protein [Brevibacillus laterosporus]|uniref:YhfH family protein n=1 Tax=Brevibacillus laterosporus TaxID=1465 RepID=A0A502J781_BRELA|nr:protein YhfH [Brevibacillus laterosporus]QDX92613.1 YhfH family protein [Brevibacillus laterosporus]TPG93210.1 YhfH family protein [Brevibacillus laterosporus]